MRQRCYRRGLFVPAAGLRADAFLKARRSCCRCCHSHPIAVGMTNIGVVGASAAFVGADFPVCNVVMRHHSEVVRMRCGKLGNCLFLPC